MDKEKVLFITPCVENSDLYDLVRLKDIKFIQKDKLGNYYLHYIVPYSNYYDHDTTTKFIKIKPNHKNYKVFQSIINDITDEETTDEEGSSEDTNEVDQNEIDTNEVDTNEVDTNEICTNKVDTNNNNNYVGPVINYFRSIANFF